MSYKRVMLAMLACLGLAGCAMQTQTQIGYSNPVLKSSAGMPLPPPTGGWPDYYDKGGESGGSGGRN
jgi:hypothetical protein